MDKATKVAVKKYPYGTFDGELGDSLRAACAVGYLQAEKDLALTGEDMRLAFKAVNDALDNCEGKTRAEVLEDALQRFNEQREKK